MRATEVIAINFVQERIRAINYAPANGRSVESLTDGEAELLIRLADSAYDNITITDKGLYTIYFKATYRSGSRQWPKEQSLIVMTIEQFCYLISIGIQIIP